MRKNKNKEKCDNWTQQQIARAEYFVACLIVGPENGGYHKRESPTLEGARTLKKQMEQQLPLLWKKVMIYAVTKGDHLSIFVE